MPDKDSKKLEFMRKFISVLPEENLAAMLRMIMAEEQKKDPRRFPTQPKK
jgi:hypothetical protein